MTIIISLFDLGSFSLKMKTLSAFLTNRKIDISYVRFFFGTAQPASSVVWSKCLVRRGSPHTFEKILLNVSYCVEV